MPLEEYATRRVDYTNTNLILDRATLLAELQLGGAFTVSKIMCGKWRMASLTCGVGGRLPDGMQHLHVSDVMYVQRLF